jgi:hypothetical protein
MRKCAGVNVNVLSMGGVGYNPFRAGCLAPIAEKPNGFKDLRVAEILAAYL